MGDAFMLHRVKTRIPKFTYTGNYQFIDDGSGNWRIKFLSSGTLTFTSLGNARKGIDVFLVGGGAGWMASKPVGTRFPFFEAATEMIRVSDNSATNLLIKRLGGKTSLNTRFQALGLPATVVNNWLPDLDGTNTTSARDLARSIALVDTGEKLSPRARDLFREIMATSRTDTLIPLGLLQGLGKDASDPDSELLSFGVTAYNKTGDIGIAYSDAALIHLPTGQRAVAAFMVKGPFNDPRSADLIRSMAAEAAKTLVGRR